MKPVRIGWPFLAFPEPNGPSKETALVKARRKPLEQIKELLADYAAILNVGCGGCASVCLVGGQREVAALNAELDDYFRLNRRPKKLGACTVERQCNEAFLAELDPLVGDYDCMLSMACGAGAQLMAERYPRKPVFPAVDTLAIGVDRALGVYEEKCRACGDCVIGYTGGICPVTRCAKGLFNGPCGGTQAGKCEIDREINCSWYDTYMRLKEQNRLERIMPIRPPMAWRNQTQRTLVQERYAGRYDRGPRRQ
jgi:hypothetical protein